MVAYIDRLGTLLLRCGVCRQRCLEMHDVRPPEPEEKELIPITAEW
jgi:hypothetical protein